MKHIDVKALLADPARRRRLMVGVIRATQAREGIDTTEAQAQAAYDAVRAEHPQVTAPKQTDGSANNGESGAKR